MATRAQARQAVVGLLYAYDLGNEEIGNYSEELLEDNKIRNKQREFALKLFNGVLEHLDPIDRAIESHLKGWEFDKLGKVERAILRLCVYEIMFDAIDNAIVINEGVELSKKLGSDQTPKFVNGVLDAISKDAKSVDATE
ncbi:MAG: transcription antitermination factor NusB [Campylobacterota bacterium]